MFDKIRARRARDKERKFAQANGFFWLPCPVCDEPFGGHEMDIDVDLPMWVRNWQAPDEFMVICPNCVRDGHGQNIESEV